ncbi:AAA family ATPase [Candidatus Uabimicrobium amorphum]|uniref:ATPase n=1 Tax=Uabimicrobium amorphum TaxID=2596890 RepID=A0A5S9IR60_UABAM|nr:AAA family ATPase [Candidatus Uabimicrobium amorphum]BBM86603.1 ATPase [Candidatus Uabimicrobium amorphum]
MLTKNVDMNVYRCENHRATLPWHKLAQACIETHPHLLLVGPPGCGKTTCAQDMARAYSGDFEVVWGTPETEVSHLWGTWNLDGEKTIFCKGPLAMALERNVFLIIEEIHLIPLETLASILALRGQSQVTNPYTGELTPIPQDFCLIATSNSISVQCRRNSGIAMALYDDFNIIEVPTLSDQQIYDFVKVNHPTVEEEICKKAIALWKDYRGICSSNENQISLSFRSLDRLIKFLVAGIDENAAKEVTLVNAYITDKEAHDSAKMRVSLGDGSSDSYYDSYDDDDDDDDDDDEY